MQQSYSRSEKNWVLGITALFILLAAIVLSILVPVMAGPVGCCFSFLGGYAGLAVSGVGLLDQFVHAARGLSCWRRRARASMYGRSGW